MESGCNSQSLSPPGCFQIPPGDGPESGASSGPPALPWELELRLSLELQLLAVAASTAVTAVG